MNIILATGIYPPDIGGPATYVCALADELTKKGNEVRVVTYGDEGGVKVGKCEGVNVVYVSKSGGPILRWWRYAKALRTHAADADVIIAFSSVSVGVPLALARLQNSKKILRLGGDFFWERYTDRGGMKGLREWYASHPLSLLFMGWLLQTFDHVVYSTEFQKKIHESVYPILPSRSVILNAMPIGMQVEHKPHQPFSLLFMGRFVGFKNLPALVQAVRTLSMQTKIKLTLVGDGPLKSSLQKLHLEGVVEICSPVYGEDKRKCFAEHDLLVLPSLTEISPNVALEAHALCLPVLLSKETGLDPGMRFTYQRSLKTSEEISAAILERIEQYESPQYDTAVRDYNMLALEWISLLKSL